MAAVDGYNYRLLFDTTGGEIQAVSAVPALINTLPPSEVVVKVAVLRFFKKAFRQLGYC